MCQFSQKIRVLTTTRYAFFPLNILKLWSLLHNPFSQIKWSLWKKVSMWLISIWLMPRWSSTFDQGLNIQGLETTTIRDVTITNHINHFTLALLFLISLLSVSAELWGTQPRANYTIESVGWALFEYSFRTFSGHFSALFKKLKTLICQLSCEWLHQ